MSPAEFVRRMGFPPECADLFSKYWSDAPEMELLPECFLTGFFERYAEKLAVPTPFAPEIPELSARVAAEKLLRFYANLILRAAYEFPHADLGGWPAPEQFLTPRQCGLFQLLLALAALPRIEGAYRELGLPPEYAAGPARWIGGTIAIYAAAHDGNPGHDLRQIHWLKCYMEKRLFRVGRFEFMIQGAPEWLPAIYRSRETGRTIAFCRTGWQLDRSGFRVRRGATGEYTARFDELANRVTGIPIDPATGRAEVHRTETIDTGEYAPVLSAHDWVPGIHIPGGGGMTPEATKASLVQAVEFFRTYNIKLPFTYEIMTRQDVLDNVKAGRTENFYYVDLFQQDLVRKGYYLGVRFESVQPILLENMGWLFLASGFCIFGLLAVFIVTIMVIMKQQKLSVIKNDFINNMTHEFKTPIATISLATSALTKEKVLNDREQILKFNAMIKSENNRMNKYVERILQQAKLDRKELQMNLVEAGVNELVREAVEHFALLVQNAGGTLACHLDEGDFVRTVDEVHLMNAVCNLIDNAIKYSGGAPDIQVYTRAKDGHILIGVQDHGIGISKDAQKKVFKRFYRVPSGNVHNVKGFGLGLSYVKSIVELHGGTVRLTSKKGKGTLVEIEL